MWYSYLLANHQIIFDQQKLNPESPNQKLDFNILQNCLKKEIQQRKIKSVIPYLIDFQAQIKSQPTQIVQEMSCQQFQQEKESLRQKKVKLFYKNSQKLISKKVKTKKVKKNNDLKTERGKNPGRNSTSNIFRIFLKFCSKSIFEQILRQKIEGIKKAYELSYCFQNFKRMIKQLAPSTSNYINFKQFSKIWRGQCQFSKIFRTLFHWFINNFAINHSVTLKGKHKMMKESIIHFLNNLRQIEEELEQKQNSSQNDECPQSKTGQAE